MLAHTTIGAALVAGGAAALNQIAERDLDERMPRTLDRPVASGRLHPVEAAGFAVRTLNDLDRARASAPGDLKSPYRASQGLPRRCLPSTNS